MNIEYGHVYIEDMLKDNWKKEIIDKITKEIPFVKNFNGKKIVLIDDKDYTLNQYQKEKYKSEIQKLYSDIGIKPDIIYFEKDYSENAIDIFNNIDEKYKKSIYFKKQNKYVDIIKIENTDIPVRERKEDHIRNYCVMLSAAWSLYKENKYGNNYIVLPEKYKKVENNVSLLLDLLNYKNNNKYFFY